MPRKVSTTADHPQGTMTTRSSKQSSSPTTTSPPKALLARSKSSTTISRSSSIPSFLRLPLLILLSLTLSSLLYSVVPASVGGDLARVSRSLDQWWQVVVLLGWRLVELGVVWTAGGDAWDGAAVVVTGRGPTLFLLHAFYALSPTSVATSLLIDILTTYIPFRLLRPISAAHHALIFKPLRSSSARPTDPPLSASAHAVLTDSTILLMTTLLPAAIYATALHLAFASYLPVYLVTEFDTISSVEIAHSGTFITLLPLAVWAGYAARVFIFAPAAAASSTSTTSDSDVASSKEVTRFNPSTASLLETTQYNLWGWSERTKTTILRTLALAVITGAGTIVQTWVTVEGVSFKGAVGWAVVWKAASVVVGGALGFVASA